MTEEMRSKIPTIERARTSVERSGSALRCRGGLRAPHRGCARGAGEVGTSWHVLVADPITPGALAGRLEAVRAAMASSYHDGLAAEDFQRLPRPGPSQAPARRSSQHDGSTGFIVPRADEHQGEYVPPCGQRLTWLTGFTGSAGLAIVLRDRAALFVDGRYTLQAAAQVDAGLFEIRHLIDEPPARWIATALKAGTVLAYDPWLHTPHEVERFRAAAEKAGAMLRAVSDNPLDRVWPGRPAAPIAPVVPHPERFAGESAQSKRTRLGRALAGGGGCRGRADHARIDRLAPQHPRRRRAAHAAAAVFRDPPREDGTVTLFIDRRKLAPGLERHLGNGVTVCAPGAAGAGARRTRRRGRPGAGRSGECGLVGGRPARCSGSEDPPCGRSLPAAQGLQECDRARRHARGASPRRRCADALSRLACARSAERRPRRDCRQRPARGASAARTTISRI